MEKKNKTNINSKSDENDKETEKSSDQRKQISEEDNSEDENSDYNPDIEEMESESENDSSSESVGNLEDPQLRLGSNSHGNSETEPKQLPKENMKKEDKKPQKDKPRKVSFIIETDDSGSDEDNPLKLPEYDPDKDKKDEREKELTKYFNNIKDEREKELTKDIKDNDIKDNDINKSEETLEESLQRMQFEESIKQLIKQLDTVKFTISPQELSHLFKNYPSILRPEVAATFLAGSNIPAVHNMIAHGFKLDRRIEDYYIKMKEETLEGLTGKERKRLEQYYEISDKWIKENIKN